MTGLFKLQTTLVNVPGGGLPELHQNIDVIRQVFRYTWEHIKTFFQNCRAFGSDVSNLKESLGTESVEDCIELLGEMSDGAVDLLEQAQELLKSLHEWRQDLHSIYNKRRGSLIVCCAD
jgi:hypothetical protein